MGFGRKIINNREERTVQMKFFIIGDRRETIE